MTPDGAEFKYEPSCKEISTKEFEAKWEDWKQRIYHKVISP